MEEDNKEELIEKFAAEGDWNEVLKLYDELYPDDITEQEEGWDESLTLSQKVDRMIDIGKHGEAIKILKTLIRMHSDESGEISRAVLNTKLDLGRALLDQNKFDEALELLNVVLEKQIELLGDEGRKEYQVDTKILIGNCLERQEKLEEALSFYEQAYNTFVEIYGVFGYIVGIECTIKSIKLKIAAASEELDLESILKIVDYGPTVFSIKVFGEDENAWYNEKDTVLHRAVRTNIVSLIKIVFDEIVLKCEGDAEKLKECLNYENCEIHTPLTLAVQYDCQNAVQFLLENGIEHGIDINKVTGRDRNALLIAKYRVNESIQKLLLEYNAVVLSKPE